MELSQDGVRGIEEIREEPVVKKRRRRSGACEEMMPYSVPKEERKVLVEIGTDGKLRGWERKVEWVQLTASALKREVEGMGE